MPSDWFWLCALEFVRLLLAFAFGFAEFVCFVCCVGFCLLVCSRLFWISPDFGVWQWVFLFSGLLVLVVFCLLFILFSCLVGGLILN